MADRSEIRGHILNRRHHGGGACVWVGGEEGREGGCKLSQATDAAKQTGICPLHLSVSTPQQRLSQDLKHTQGGWMDICMLNRSC